MEAAFGTLHGAGSVSHGPPIATERGPTIHVERARVRSAECCEERLACVSAVAARPLAEAAVLVVLGMTLALLCADAARRAAGREQRAQDRRVARGLARGHAAGGDARVGAIEARANATDHLRDVGLSEVGIGADRAGGRALRAGLDAAGNGVEIADGPWMRFEQLLNGHLHLLSSSPMRIRP
jgi:hypothetical protein